MKKLSFILMALFFNEGFAKVTNDYFLISVPGKGVKSSNSFRCDDLNQTPAKCLAEKHNLIGTASLDILSNSHATVKIIQSGPNTTAPKDIPCGSLKDAKSCLEAYTGSVIRNKDYMLKVNGKEIKCSKNETEQDCLSRVNPLTEKQEAEMTSPDNKYSACNKWIREQFPAENMMYINGDGKVVQGSNNTEYFGKEGVTFVAKNSDVNPKDRSVTLSTVTRLAPSINSDGFVFKRNFNSDEKYIDYTKEGIKVLPLRDYTTANFKIGVNGKCYVEEVVENSNRVNQWGEDIQVASSKKCHDILKFQEENPGLANCTNPKVFEKLNNLLGNPVQSTSEYRFPGQMSVGIPSQDFKSVSVSERFEQAMSLPQLLLSQAKSEIDSCDKFNLAGFAQDKALFRQLKTGKSPASSNQTTSTSIKE